MQPDQLQRKYWRTLIDKRPHLLNVKVKCTTTYEGTSIGEKYTYQKIWAHCTLLKYPVGEEKSNPQHSVLVLFEHFMVSSFWPLVSAISQRMAHQGHGLQLACVYLSSVPPYQICHHPQMWSWSSLQDVKPSGKWEKIPFHTAADASAQMFLNWAKFFWGKRYIKQFSCHYYCHNRSSVHEIFRDSKYLYSPIHYNFDYRLYTGTASQGLRLCFLFITVSVFIRVLLCQMTFAYDFFSRWLLQTWWSFFCR